MLSRLETSDPSFVHLGLSKIHLTQKQLDETGSRIQNNSKQF